MNRKLLQILAFTALFSPVVNAQSPGTPTVVTDTVHYYFNKMYFKTAIANEIITQYQPNKYKNNFPYYKAPASTNTGVTHLGNKFENPGTMTVTGLEAIMGKHPVTAQLSIKATLYLCNVNSAGLPILPPIDSVSATLSNTTHAIYGGNFTTPRVVTGDFAVCLRNMSTISGDTIQIVRTTSKTYTNWPNATFFEKYSDSNGAIRFAGTFQSTTNFTANGFGYGTDYEFCVAPRVQFELTASQLWPQPIIDNSYICTFTPLTFTNTSSKYYSNRMYNFNEFYLKWNTTTGLATPAFFNGWPTDSTFKWMFDHKDNGKFTGYTLPAGGGNNTITFATDSVIYPYCTNTNYFQATFRGMGLMGRSSAPLKYQENFTVCIVYCNGDTVGVKDPDSYSLVKLFPNPSSSGKINVTGLTGKNTLMVYDLVGRQIIKQETASETTELNLSQYADGAYVVRIVNDSNKSRTVKITKRTE